MTGSTRERGASRISPYLSPGTYTFRVIAANSDGIWNNAGAALSSRRRGAVLPDDLVHRARGARHDGDRPSGLSLADRADAAATGRAGGVLPSSDRIAGEPSASASPRNCTTALGQTSAGDQEPRAGRWDVASRPAPMAKEQFDEISLAASQAIEEARRIAYDLRPYHLDRLGLTQSLEEMIERVAASTPIRFTVEASDARRCLHQGGRGDLLSHRPGERQQHRQAFAGERGGRRDSARRGCPSR